MSKKAIHRIDEFRELKNLSVNKLESLLGTSNGYLGKQIKSEGSVGSDILERLFSEFPDFNPEYILTGKGSLIKENYNPKTIDQMIDEKIDQKLQSKGYTLEEYSQLHQMREFILEQMAEAKKVSDKQKGSSKSS